MKEKDTKTQKKEPKKGWNLVKSILNTIINIMIVIVLITSILIAVLALTSKANNGVSTILGYTIQTIESDSMKGGSPDGYPEGDFETGDLMIAKATNNDDSAKYELGDIATYITYDTEGEQVLMVHRIVGTGKNSAGETVYQTQGDNREMSEVPDQQTVDGYLSAGSFVSVYYCSTYKGIIIKGFGSFLNYLQSQQGFFFIVLLPMIIFFMYELIRVVLNFTSYRKAKTDEDKKAAVDAAVAEALSGNSDNSLLENATDEEREQFKQFLAFKKQQMGLQDEEQSEDQPAEQSEEKADEQPEAEAEEKEQDAPEE